MPDKRAVTILRHLLRAISQYGMPRAIRTDNEAFFHSLLFRTTLKFLGVRQQFSQPGMPWQNGRIERLFGTLKEKLDQLTVEDLPAGGHCGCPCMNSDSGTTWSGRTSI
ncbi:integrase core domain-containing protein [Pseudoduganella sp. R-43]|uniref:integrase core domain-containing protein n=1 Tax=Pseudoduganella sp. R-43 TaxID=3404063 RepID=UPI003CE7011E